ncbi:MAG: hypothetical protein JWQ04_2776 [Pedosphaera sp.]|nr:hypothetical protein [Pedosphaera sp.]
MNAVEFNELISRAVSRALKEGVGEGKMDMLQMAGSLDFQKHAVLGVILEQTKRAQASGIVIPAPGTRLNGLGPV